MSHKLLEKSHIQIVVSGTTVVLGVIWNNVLFMANVGDSRSFLASKKGNHVIVRCTTDDHKPETREEKHRIESYGGIVMAQKDDDGSDFGPNRVWNQEMTAPGLAMSRSVGDGLAHSLGVSATPDIVKHSQTPDDKFIVMCSDGVFEFQSNQYCMGKVLPFYTKNDPVGACNKLINDSTLMWKQVIFCQFKNQEEDSIDDITALVIFIRTEK